MNGCQKKSPAQDTYKEVTEESVVQVDAYTVKAIKSPRLVSISGNIQALEDSDLASGAQGKVISVHAERGQVVDKGDILARLDARLPTAQMQEAKASLLALDSQLKLAHADARRSAELLKSGSVTIAQHERTLAQESSAVAQKEAAEARLRLIQAALEDTTIRAPFAGVIVERTVSPGEYVRADSKIVTLVATQKLRVELNIPESYANAVRIGQKIRFKVAQSEHDEYATLSFVGPQLRKGSRDLVAEALLENSKGRYQPGQFVMAEIETVDQLVPAVPIAALRQDGQIYRVFLMNHGNIEEKLVEIGATQDDMVLITQGIKVGDVIAKTAKPQLHDGVHYLNAQ